MKILIALLITFPILTFSQAVGTKDRETTAEEQRKEWQKEQEEALRRWREQMDEDRKLIQKYFKSDLFKQFDKEVEKVLKSFDPGAFQQFFDDDNFDKMFDQIKPSQGLNEGDFRWIETPKERILILKMTMPKDAPFEIKIENNHIIVKGTITEKREDITSQGTNYYETSRLISKTFPIPNDVDSDKAQFENKPGEILIKLPKKKVSDLYKKKVIKPDPAPRPRKKPGKRPGLRPIPKSEGDLTI